MSWNNAVPILRFGGLRNDLDTIELDNTSMRHILNWDIDDKGWLHTRDDYLEIGEAETLFVTDDKQAGYVINAGMLYQINFTDDTLIPLQVDIGAGPYHFTNAGRRVYFVGSEKSFAIYPDRVVPWGIAVPPMPEVTIAPGAGSLSAGTYRIALAYRDTAYGNISGTHHIYQIEANDNDAFLIGNISQIPGYEVVVLVSQPQGSVLYYAGYATVSDYFFGDVTLLARPFDYVATYPPPLRGPLAFWRASIWSAIYNPSEDFTEILSSVPNSHHHFPILNQADITELGEVRMLVGTSVGLLIGTDRDIILYRDINQRIELAQYGVPKGIQWDYDKDRNVIFTTECGIRRVGAGETLFQNPNEDKYLTNWGSVVGCGFIMRNGISQFISCGLENADPGFRSPLIPIEPHLVDHDFDSNDVGDFR